MLETILSHFTIQVKEKIADATNELKRTYDFQAVEDMVAELVDTLATDLLQACLKDVLEDREILSELKQIGAEQGFKFHGFRTLNVYVYTGHCVTVKSPWFVKQGKKPGRKKNGPNGRGTHVGLDVLGFLSHGSGKFVSWVVKMAVLMPSYEIAKEALQDRGMSLAVNTIRRYCRELGRLGIARRGNVSLNGQEDLTGATLVIEVDGGRLRVREAKRGRKKASQKRQGYHAPWKEPKLFTMYLQDAQGQLVKTFPPIHDATMGNDDEVFALMARYLDQLNLSVAERVVVCGDGARWIWLRVDSLLRDRGISADKMFQSVDYTHAKQNLQEIVALLPPKRQKRMMKKWKTFLFKGDITGLGQSIKSGLKGNALKKGIKKWNDYFVRNAQRMQYTSFQAQHLPCGSGHVESAIRRVINLRLKAPGTFWTQDMAEYFLFLRSQLLSGRWLIFMKNVRRRVASLAEGLRDAHSEIAQV